MKHEEKTDAAIDRCKIIHVNFFGSRREPRHEAQLRQLHGEIGTVTKFQRRRRGDSFAWRAPWALRILALIGILILSLLVL